MSDTSNTPAIVSIPAAEANAELQRMMRQASERAANANDGIAEAEATEAIEPSNPGPSTPELDAQHQRFVGLMDVPRQLWPKEDLDAFDAEVAEHRIQEHATATTCKNASLWLGEPDEPDNPLISGLLEVGSMFAIVGPAKAAKSWLEEQLAVCIATGSNFFGREVKRQRVYVANIEVSPKQYKKRLRSICHRMNIPTAELNGWLFVDNLRGKTATWEWCFDEAKYRNADVVIIDPFYQIFTGKETDEGDCQEAVNEMKKFLAAGFTLGIVFHAPKGKPGDREIVDMISGSSVLVRFPENVIAILPHAEEKDARVVDCSVLRDYPPPDPFTVKFDDGALVLASDITPKVRGSHRAGARKSADEKDAERVKHQNDLRQKAIAAAHAYITKCGEKMPNTSQFKAALKRTLPKSFVEQFMKEIKDGAVDGIVSQPELFNSGNGKRRGRRPEFITTPDKADAYRQKLQELPLEE